jgi:hypothetical protein
LGDARRRRGRRDPGRTGFRIIAIAVVLALAVGLLRWQPFGSRVAASSLLLWVATGVVSLLLLMGFARCLRSIFRCEGSEGRARVGAVLGVALAGAIGIYALSGGYAAIVLPPEVAASAETEAVPGTQGAEVAETEAVPGTQGYESEGYQYRGLELQRYTNEEYHFRVDAPATPYALKTLDLRGWDFGVRVVVDVPGVLDDAVFEVYASVHAGSVNSRATVDAYLEDVETLYPGSDVLRSATAGRLNGRLCAIARSRYSGSESPEPVVTTAFWVPGSGYEYVVRCIAFEDDWPRARRPMMDIADTFVCW